MFTPAETCNFRSDKRRNERRKGKMARERERERSLALSRIICRSSLSPCVRHKPFPDGRVSTHAGEKSRSAHCCRLAFESRSYRALRYANAGECRPRRFRELKLKVRDNACTGNRLSTGFRNGDTRISGSGLGRATIFHSRLIRKTHSR